jgi:hypothetical protein
MPARLAIFGYGTPLLDFFVYVWDHLISERTVYMALAFRDPCQHTIQAREHAAIRQAT